MNVNLNPSDLSVLLRSTFLLLQHQPFELLGVDLAPSRSH